jgi:glycosyltransferase involved in cell wall biosynthesis
MKPKIVFIERKPTASVSIESVFRQIAKDLWDEYDYDIEFQQLPYGYGIASIIKNLLFFRPRPADIYHITGDVHYIALRLPGRKTVLTIHDLVFLRRRTGLRRALLKWLFLTGPVHRVARLTTISNATRNEIAAELPALAKPVEVITNPLIDGFVAEPLEPFNAERPVILQIGTTPNKNLETLIEALRGTTCSLRIIGDISPDIGNRLKNAAVEYSNATQLDEQAIVDEYRNADIVTFCSTYEGFGLPIIEAQAMRKPVVTSNIPPMNEVAGEGAVLVDPHDPSAIRAAIERIRDDDLFRQNVIQNGIENLKRFDSGSIAREFEAVYRGLIL